MRRNWRRYNPTSSLLLPGGNSTPYKSLPHVEITVYLEHWIHSLAMDGISKSISPTMWRRDRCAVQSIVLNRCWTILRELQRAQDFITNQDLTRWAIIYIRSRYRQEKAGGQKIQRCTCLDRLRRSGRFELRGLLKASQPPPPSTSVRFSFGRYAMKPIDLLATTAESACMCVYVCVFTLGTKCRSPRRSARTFCMPLLLFHRPHLLEKGRGTVLSGGGG